MTSTTSESRPDVRELALTLLFDSDIEALIDSIRGHSRLETVHVSCPNSQVTQPQWASQRLHRLFSQIGSFPNLKHVQFKSLGWGDHDNMIPLSLFTSLLNHQSTASLQFFEMVLVGPIFCQTSDMSHFCTALQKQSNLREFRLTSCYFSHDWLSTPFSSLDQMVFTLSELPRLEIVKMKAANKGHLGRFQADSLSALLCQSNNNIRNLTIENFALGNPHVAAVAHAIDANATLQELYLNLSGETNLDACLLPSSLAGNHTLRHLQLRLAKQKNLDRFLIHTAAALKHNSSLENFSVFGSFKVDLEVEQAFAEMLESNCILGTVKIPSSHIGNWKPKMDMLLALNRRGRQRLLEKSECINLQEWITHFASPASDLTFVYYYAHRISPILCERVLG